MALFSSVAGAGLIFTGSTLFGSTLAASFAAASLNLVAVTAFGYVGNKLIGSVLGAPKLGGGAATGINRDLATGETAPRSFVVGRTAVAGSLVYAETWGKDGKTPNAYLTQVIALSDLPIKAVNEMYVDSEKVTIRYDQGMTSTNKEGAQGQFYPIGYPVEEFNNDTEGGGYDKDDDHMWFKFHDGTQTSADGFVVNVVSRGAREYLSNRVGRGIAYVVVTSLYDNELFGRIPEFLFEVSGLKLYNPASDGSVGGTGSHRWNDPTTWGGPGDDNPVVQIYNILRGISYNGVHFFGLQNMSPVRLPTSRWIEEINYAAAPRTVLGETRQRFQAGLEILLNDKSVADWVEELSATCNMRIANNGYAYTPSISRNKAAVFSITDDDILINAAQTYKPLKDINSAFNSVSISYPLPGRNWTMFTHGGQRNTDLEKEDGDRYLPKSVDIPAIYYSEQAQRVLKATLRESRRARQITIALPPEYFPIEPGDLISWTSTRNGFVNKKFRVTGATDTALLEVIVSMVEFDPDDYDYNIGTEYVAPPTFSVVPFRKPPQSISSFSAVAVTLLNRRPAIKIAWATDVTDVTALQYEVRLKGQTVVFGSGQFAVSQGEAVLGEAFIPDTRYQVRGRYVPGSPRPMIWSSWFTVRTDDTRFSAQDLYDEIIDSTKIAQNLELIGAVSALPPASGYTGPQLVFRETDKKIYRYTGSGWTRAVDGNDLLANSIKAGAISAGAVRTSALDAEAVTADKIGAVTMAALNLVAKTGDIDDLAVTTIKVAGGAITRSEQVSTSGASAGNNNWKAYVADTIYCPDQSLVYIFAKFTFSNNPAQWQVRIFDVDDNEPVVGSFTVGNEKSGMIFATKVRFTGNARFRLQFKCPSSTSMIAADLGLMAVLK